MRVPIYDDDDNTDARVGRVSRITIGDADCTITAYSIAHDGDDDGMIAATFTDDIVIRRGVDSVVVPIVAPVAVGACVDDNASVADGGREALDDDMPELVGDDDGDHGAMCSVCVESPSATAQTHFAMHARADPPLRSDATLIDTGATTGIVGDLDRHAATHVRNCEVRLEGIAGAVAKRTGIITYIIGDQRVHLAALELDGVPFDLISERALTNALPVGSSITWTKSRMILAVGNKEAWFPKGENGLVRLAVGHDGQLLQASDTTQPVARATTAPTRATDGMAIRSGGTALTLTPDDTATLDDTATCEFALMASYGRCNKCKACTLWRAAKAKKPSEADFCHNSGGPCARCKKAYTRTADGIEKDLGYKERKPCNTFHCEDPIVCKKAKPKKKDDDDDDDGDDDGYDDDDDDDDDDDGAPSVKKRKQATSTGKKKKDADEVGSTPKKHKQLGKQRAADAPAPTPVSRQDSDDESEDSDTELAKHLSLLPSVVRNLADSSGPSGAGGAHTRSGGRPIAQPVLPTPLALPTPSIQQPLPPPPSAYDEMPPRPVAPSPTQPATPTAPQGALAAMGQYPHQWYPPQFMPPRLPVVHVVGQALEA